MQVNALKEPPADAAATLVSHLRQHPQDAHSDPAELAGRLGLEASFVEQVLDAVRLPTPAPQKRDRVSFTALRQWGERGLHVFDERVVAAPKRFVILSVLVLLAFGGIVNFANHTDVVRGMPYVTQMASLGMSVLIGLTLALHMACYFRRGMMRYPLVGGVVVWVTTSALLLFELYQNGDFLEPSDAALAGLGVGFMSLMYTGVGAVCAVVGGWVRFKRLEMREERMSRQELLERYFEIQTRMRGGNSDAPHDSSWRDWPVVEAFQENPHLWSFVSGLAMSMPVVLVSAPAGVHPMSPDPRSNLVVFVVLALLAVANMLALLAVGFLSGTPLRAFGSSIVYCLGGVLAFLVPIGNFGPEFFESSSAIAQTLLNTFAFSMIGTVAGMGASVQSQYLREQSIRRNDQATLAAEMLRLQWMLSADKKQVCVLFIDAAKSSEMKAAADPLAVEYSFREYQDWIEAVCGAGGGIVHSTAGDGAVVSFESCASAFRAAKRMQTEIDAFNRDVNRLKSPFRLRIGLHVGEVVGSLEKIEFAHVIDVAAHVQAAAPTSGIAVTEDVAAELPEEEFVQMAREIAGRRVFLALNPVDE
jgi:class 3 adenylate cyclase